MSGYHKTIAVGNSSADAQLRYLADGTPVASFSLAVNEKRGDVKETIWYRVTVWRKQAEICAQYVKSGREYLVEGRLTHDKATGGPRVWIAPDGSARSSYELTADRVVFLQGGNAGKDSPESQSDEQFDDDSSIPF